MYNWKFINVTKEQLGDEKAENNFVLGYYKDKNNQDRPMYNITKIRKTKRCVSKKNSYRLKKIYRILRRGVYISFFLLKIFLLFFKA